MGVSFTLWGYRFNSTENISILLPSLATLIPSRHHLPFGSHGIDLVNEDNTGTVLVSHPEQLAHKLGAVAKVLLDQLAANLATETWSNLVLL